MGGANVDALELALALLKDPPRRHALRERRLPSDVGRLLEIAGAPGRESLADTAALHGVNPAELVDASRFFAREVLFHPRADAYRMLGLNRDASAEQIKAHHRLLQHWLHPDRLGEGEDSLFAARVNSAWNLLRTPGRRAAYDQVDPQRGGSSASVAPSVHVHAWSPSRAAGAPPALWRQRLPVLALLVACALLALLTLRDAARPSTEWTAFDRAVDAAIGTTPVVRAPLPVNDVALDARTPTALAPAEPSPRANAPTEKHPASASPAGAPAARAYVPRARRSPTEQSVVAAAARAAPMPKAPLHLDPPMATAPRAAAAAAPPASKAPAGAEAPVALADAVREGEAAAVQRAQMARRTGERLLHYLGAPNRSPPPIWNSAGALSAADLLRHRLHARGRATLVAAPRWQIGGTNASLVSDFVVHHARVDSADTTRLRADLVWRENHWLVSGLSMEDTR